MMSRQTRITADYRQDDVQMMVLSKDLFSHNFFSKSKKINDETCDSFMLLVVVIQYFEMNPIMET